MSNKNELIALTSIRGIAAIWVILYHFLIPFNRDVACVSCSVTMLERSYLAVDLFFVLSGYILALVYAKTFDENNNVPTYFRFIKARIARIYPLHLFCLLIFVLWQLIMLLTVTDHTLNSRNNSETFFYNIFLIHAWGTWNDVSWNYPSWSISAEFFAYLTFPIMLAVIRFHKVIKSLVLLISITLILIYPHLHELTIGNGQAIYRCLIGFYLGVAGYLLFKTIKLSYLKTTFIQYSLLLLIVLLVFSEVSDSWVMLLWFPLIFSLSNDQGGLAELLKNKFLHFLGVVSYSIYLIHVIVMMVYRDLRVHFFNAPPSLGLIMESILMLSLVIITVVLSKYTYTYVESKYRKLIK
ncbi:acyltransferase family protein [Flavobacterium sp. W21_SRS_FM6]|uniref:acyltransferase family protein n=1 Tax=Flavobacterium sp. W21_SRS_FM6 TaxID=3240268 RepID=UPI003F93521E